MKDYIFIKRQHQVSAWWLVAVIVICLGVVGRMEYLDLEKAEKLKKLEQSHYHIWEMDESCSRQLLNSADGVLRLKVSSKTLDK